LLPCRPTSADDKDDLVDKVAQAQLFLESVAVGFDAVFLSKAAAGGVRGGALVSIRC
jgi:hypothetical protein